MAGSTRRKLGYLGQTADRLDGERLCRAAALDELLLELARAKIDATLQHPVPYEDADEQGIRVGLAGGFQRQPGRPRSSSDEPRAGSLPARVIDWAGKRKKPFGTNDITKRFKLSRAHASMLLSRLANGPYPIEREKRGVYVYRA